MGVLGTINNFQDVEAHAHSLRRSPAFGYVGTYCIHLGQVGYVVAAFSPTPEEVDYARRVLEVYTVAEQEGRSATSLDGAMIDRTVAIRA